MWIFAFSHCQNLRLMFHHLMFGFKILASLLMHGIKTRNLSLSCIYKVVLIVVIFLFYLIKKKLSRYMYIEFELFIIRFYLLAYWIKLLKIKIYLLPLNLVTSLRCHYVQNQYILKWFTTFFQPEMGWPPIQSRN